MVLKNAHAEKIFELIDSAIKLAGISFSSLDGIAVSSGPGSFTGLRIGLSAAKGIAFGASLPIIPVPTFDALALQISQYLPDRTRFFIANKVNMDEVYFAGFQVIGNNYIFTENLEIIKREDLLKTGNNIIFGNAADNNISAPDALYIAKWSRQSGSEKAVYEFDDLEPAYHKNFIIKENKK
jgi:tRNA threonylcarbamoyladenosine biosynthesis protein TsaB